MTTLNASQVSAYLPGEMRLRSSVRPVPAVDPIAFFVAAEAVFPDRFFWSSPGRELSIAGAGRVLAIAASGPDRFRNAATDWKSWQSRISIDGEEAPATGPLLTGGFAFEPSTSRDDAWRAFGDGLLIVPEVMLTQTAGGTWLTTNSLDVFKNRVSPAEDLLCAARGAASEVPESAAWDAVDWPDDEAWMRAVRQVTTELTSAPARLQKVVLARRRFITAARLPDASHVLRRLAGSYPECFLFAVGRGESCFLGATPERLVKFQEGRVQASSLAGTTRRGRTEDEDAQLGQWLLHDAKERREHDIVAQALAESLQSAGVTLEQTPPKPVLMKMRNVQHLFTPIRGHAAGASILDLVGAAHPTPAVGGYPRTEAMNVIRDVEPFDRGWYAGTVGWADRRGEGDFSVGIRSCLLRPAEAWLYAGCGIVSESDAATELAESNLKLQPMMSALGLA